MGLRLLGPVDLVVDGRSVDLGGPRQRAVLAVLGLNANRVVPVEQLIDAVWDTAPPSTARGQIQTCISALRRILGDAGHPGAIATRQPGYMLVIGSEELDVLRFSALVAEARSHADEGGEERAAAVLREALALWRGTALAGVPSGMVRREATVLEDRRLAAVEELVRLDLALGRHEEICHELRALVAEHPLRERLHCFLMLALYRAGRQAEALEAGRLARAVMVEEIGVEPSQELQELTRAILNRDPSLDLPADLRPPPPRSSGSGAREQRSTEPRAGGNALVPQQLPPSVADFTGREDLLEEIKRLLTEGGEEGGARWSVPIVAISGKGGVGKSSLAVRAAHELSARFPDGQLYADMRTPGGEDRTARLLARFLRALGVPGTAVPEDTDERVELFRSKLSGRRLLLVLDDATSEEQVRPLLPGSPTCAVIVTSRKRLGGLTGAHRLDIDVFDTDKSIELLTRIVGEDRVEAEREAAVELVTSCGGLPLALRIAGARLASRPHWQMEGLVRRLRDEARRLDELAHHGLELRSNMELAYRGLGESAARLFRRLSMVRVLDFPDWTAAALLDVSPAEGRELLDTLVDAQLLDVVVYPGSRSPRYRFHDLIRIYAKERLSAEEDGHERAAALSRLLGGWLALAEEAHRSEYGGDYTILHGSAPRWRPAGGWDPDGMADPAYWWEAERRALTAAVRQAAQAGLDELCWDLALTAVTLFEAKGYFDDWRECATVAREAAERAGNRTGTAAMLYSLGTLHMFQTQMAEARYCFEAALAAFRAEGDAHGCALVLRNAAHVDGLYGDIPRMLDRYDESLRTMRAVGDRVGEAHILRSLAKFHLGEGDPQTAGELLDEALAICREVSCPRMEVQVVHRFAEVYMATGRIDLARQALHRVLRMVRDTGDRIGEVHVVYGLGLLRHREGRLDTAETTLAHALGLARRVGEQLIEAKALYALGEIALARGGEASAARHLRAAHEIFGKLGSVLWQAKALVLLSEVRAGQDSARGDLERAVRLLSSVDSRESAKLLAELRAAHPDLPAGELLGSGAEVGGPASV
ncbi:BTAD domain-containing putative transcriptional regulator [Streptomyces sp. KL2]|uniref:AfsR/SARP family transcriptional regulator n=1 Tax=Streptomyces sp. KL2 TaxID=3050126 RepID=UPI00397E5871